MIDSDLRNTIYRRFTARSAASTTRRHVRAYRTLLRHCTLSLSIGCMALLTCSIGRFALGCINQSAQCKTVVCGDVINVSPGTQAAAPQTFTSDFVILTRNRNKQQCSLQKDSERIVNHLFPCLETGGYLFIIYFIMCRSNGTQMHICKERKTVQQNRVSKSIFGLCLECCP